MTPKIVTAIVWLYIGIAVIASVCVAQVLERRLKARLPQTRPYRWGFYVGCMGLACAPFALLFIWRIAISAANNQAERVGEFIGYTVYYSFQSICGWFIIKRRRWAWAFGTIFSFNIVLWIINDIYGHNRWKEFRSKLKPSATAV
jgi:drug/metabolite transporter (DMT)-like permease